MIVTGGFVGKIWRVADISLSICDNQFCSDFLLLLPRNQFKKNAPPCQLIRKPPISKKKLFKTRNFSAVRDAQGCGSTAAGCEGDWGDVCVCLADGCGCVCMAQRTNYASFKKVYQMLT
jgi:hypothetical protein